MSMWHAYASRSVLEPGTELLVTGGSEAVSVQAADQLTIEAPGDERITADVVDCSEDEMLVAIGDSPVICLDVSFDVAGAFDKFKLSDGFSRQGWVVR